MKRGYGKTWEIYTEVYQENILDNSLSSRQLLQQTLGLIRITSQLLHLRNRPHSQYA